MIVKRVEKQEQQHVEFIRSRLQGSWLFETVTKDTSFGPYRSLRSTHLASLTIDRNFNVQGVAYKCQDVDKDGQVTRYPRESRMKSLVSGTAVEGQFLLNWNSVDASGRPSIQFLEGLLIQDKGLTLGKGTFFSDVAVQSGEFCAKKISPRTLGIDACQSGFCK